MRVALSVLVCLLSALIFSLSAKADYGSEFNLYERCNSQYKNGSCDSVPLFSKRSVIEKFSACQLPGDVVMALENSSPGAGCAAVNSISKKCADSFQKIVVQQSANYCARESQQQQAAAAARSSGNSNRGASSSGNSGSNIKGATALIKGVAPLLVTAFGKKGDKGSEAKAASASGISATGSQGKQPTAGSVATNTASTSEPSKNSQASSDVSASNASNSVSSNTAPTQNLPDASLSSSDANTSKANAQSALPSQAVETSAALGPEATPAIDKMLDISKNPEAAAEGKVTSLTTAAEATNGKLRETAEASKNLAQFVGGGMAPFTLTSNALQALSQQITTYVDIGKKACLKTAEAAGFLCLEGPGNGMAAARTVLEVAGPALAAINSAQKSCSTTAKVTRMVGTAMTIAKTACVGAKLACDGSCLIAESQLKKIAIQIQELEPLIVEDTNISLENCSSKMEPARTECGRFVGQKQKTASAQRAKFRAVVEMEATPTSPGTSKFTAAKCQAHIKDIALMGLNILGTLTAQKNAKACADQLKAGDGTTTAEYCAQPANTASSYCKCQKDNSQLGCTGYVAATSSTNSITNDGKGSDQRLNTGGVSGFAGPHVGGADMNLGTVKSPLSSNTDPTKDPSMIKDSNSPAGGGYSSASAASGGAKGASGKSSELGATADSDKKKWSFGAFSGAFGGGSSGAAGKGAAGSAGRLGQKDLDVQRAIASEKFRAEVSEASGRSNWEKVRESYLRKSSSLIGR